MNRRLYFILPDVASAHSTLDDLLLARINAKRIHFLAKPGTKMGDLPGVIISARSALIKDWEIGIGVGALIGLVLGLIIMSVSVWWHTQPLPTFLTLAIGTLVGLIGGGLWTAVVATTVPITHLKPFEKKISEGKVLMTVLVPFHRANEIRALVGRKHPEAAYSGTWPTDHVIFP
jgi:hypothetical protein